MEREQRITKIDSEKQMKEETIQTLRRQISELSVSKQELNRAISSLTSEYEPLQV